MRRQSSRRGLCAAAAACAVAVMLMSFGCKLERQSPPNLTGPSDAGVSVELIATPDTVNADGVSTSQVSLVLRNSLGEPIVNHPILFQHDGDGILRPSPGSLYAGPVQTGLVMTTDGNGSTRVTYTAGRNIATVEVWVRPYGIDTSLTDLFRMVQIIQR